MENDKAEVVKDYLFKELVMLYEGSKKASGAELADMAHAMTTIADVLLYDEGILADVIIEDGECVDI